MSHYKRQIAVRIRCSCLVDVAPPAVGGLEGSSGGRCLTIGRCTTAIVGSSQHWTALSLNTERLSRVLRSERATSPLPSRGPTSGRICYVTIAFSGVPNKGDKIRSGCIGGKDKTLGAGRVLCRNAPLVRHPPLERQPVWPPSGLPLPRGQPPGPFFRPPCGGADWASGVDYPPPPQTMCWPQRACAPLTTKERVALLAVRRGHLVFRGPSVAPRPPGLTERVVAGGPTLLFALQGTPRRTNALDRDRPHALHKNDSPPHNAKRTRAEGGAVGQ